MLVFLARNLCKYNTVSSVINYGMLSFELWKRGHVFTPSSDRSSRTIVCVGAKYLARIVPSGGTTGNLATKKICSSSNTLSGEFYPLCGHDKISYRKDRLHHRAKRIRTPGGGFSIRDIKRRVRVSPCDLDKGLRCSVVAHSLMDKNRVRLNIGQSVKSGYAHRSLEC